MYLFIFICHSVIDYLAFCCESRQLLHLILNMIAVLVSGNYTIYIKF